MGQCVAHATTPLAILASCGVAFVAITRPQPFDDRWAPIKESATRIDNVSPFDSEEKWAENGTQAGLHRLNPTRVAFFDKKIRSLMHPPFSVLDAGCGGGLVSNALARLPGYTVQGVDLSPQALRYAKETAARANLTSVSFQHASIYSLPFTSESFDVVITSDVLEHLLDLPKASAEVARVLRPGGSLLFDTIDRTWSSFVVAILGAERLVRIIQSGSHDWRLFIRPQELKQGLERAGFHSFSHEAFDPSVQALAELSLFSAGLLSPSSMSGGWSIGPPGLSMVSYIGQAVKGGVFKASDRRARAAVPEAAATEAAATEAAAAEAASGPAPAQPEAQPAAAAAREERAAARELSATVEAESTSPPPPPPPPPTTPPPPPPTTQPPPPPQAASLRKAAPPKPAAAEAKAAKAPALPVSTTQTPLAPPPAQPSSTPVPPTAYTYQVGEPIELRVAGGPSQGSWIRGHVRALGKKPDTYWLHVPAMPDGQHDIPWTVPSWSIRKLEVAANYKVGDFVEIMAEAGPKQGTWMQARVVALGYLADTYDISLEGYLNVSSVSAKKLRRKSGGPPQQNATKAPTKNATVGFEVGEQAEIDNGNNTWVQCNISGAGKFPSTYDVRVKVVKAPGYHAISSVPIRFLRKVAVQAPPPPVPAPPPPPAIRAQSSTSTPAPDKATRAWAEAKGDFQAGERCLLLITGGMKKGNWTVCTVLGKGKSPNTYDVRVPAGNATKRDSDIRSVPARLLVSNEEATPFEEGEMAEVKIFQGKSMGSWVPCLIIGKSSKLRRYSIHVESAEPPGFLEVQDVSAFALRRDKAAKADNMPQWATKAKASLMKAFEVGERALVKVTGGPKAGSWTKCTIMGKGVKPGTYHIRVKAVQPPGHHDLQDIPSNAIRKAEPGELEPTFEAGAHAQILVREGPLAGSWMRCIVLGHGTELDTYNIRMMTEEPLILTDIPAVALRPAPELKDHHKIIQEQLAALHAHLRPKEPEAPVPLFQAGETAEVRAAEGWVRCVIGERGRHRNSYNIRVVSDNAEGFLEVPNVPVHKLRKNAQPTTISMLMWILEILFNSR